MNRFDVSLFATGPGPQAAESPDAQSGSGEGAKEFELELKRLLELRPRHPGKRAESDEPERNGQAATGGAIVSRPDPQPLASPTGTAEPTKSAAASDGAGNRPSTASNNTGDNGATLADADAPARGARPEAARPQAVEMPATGANREPNAQSKDAPAAPSKSPASAEAAAELTDRSARLPATAEQTEARTPGKDSPGAGPPTQVAGRDNSQIDKVVRQPAAPAPSNGTDAAQEDAEMNLAEKMEHDAGGKEQFLPEEEFSAGSRLKGTSGLEKTGPAPAPDSSIAVRAPASEHAVEQASAARAVSAPEVNAPARALERVQELIHWNAVQLQKASAESLKVVIKPGAGLELSLDLQLHKGTVEVQAILQKGDADFLGRHWSALQQQLEGRGVRVAPLITGDQLSQQGQWQGREQQEGRGDEADFDGSFFTPHRAAAAGAARVSGAGFTNGRGWETWA